ncbi:MAG: TrkH family potassium uptake protein [Oscillospiraceae bacterium]
MKKRLLTTTRVIMLGFLIGALVGAVLLVLPVSLQSGVHLGFADALFVSVSGICVTGLSTVNIGQTFSAFGQVVLLILIQLGGLGVVTFTTLVLILFRRRITLSERKLIQSAYNLDTLAGLVVLTIRVTKTALCLEGIGAIFYALVFVPEYGPLGIWYAVFHAVSAFCNAGIDILGGNSFCAYADNILLNFTTMFLIVAGGLGFPVYWEIMRTSPLNRRRGKARDTRKMSFHAQLVLIVTAVLLVLGTLLTLLFEHNNPETLGAMSWPQKIMAALFQSVTLRTAGFATIDQSGLRGASCLVCLLFMFIGGSPSGTAGGVKTIPVTLLLASMFSNIRGRKDVTILRRKIDDDHIRRCVAIVSFSFMTLLVLTTALLAVQKGSFLDILYEMTSAIGTVGLSRGLTGGLTTAGKLIVTLAMYLGRLGPITLALAFNTRNLPTLVTYAEGKVNVG